jgi:hypothetical protein
VLVDLDGGRARGLHLLRCVRPRGTPSCLIDVRSCCRGAHRGEIGTPLPLQLAEDRQLNMRVGRAPSMIPTRSLNYQRATRRPGLSEGWAFESLPASARRSRANSSPSGTHAERACHPVVDGSSRTRRSCTTRGDALAHRPLAGAGGNRIVMLSHSAFYIDHSSPTAAGIGRQKPDDAPYLVPDKN